MSDWKSKARERVKEKQQGSTIKVQEGPNCLRIMPNKKDLLPTGQLGSKGVQHPPYIEFRVHRNVGPDKFMSACGKDIDGAGACWLCDKKLPELEASDNRSRRLQAQELHAQEQFVVVASRFDPDLQKFTAPKVWWISTGSGIPGRQSQSLAVRIYSKIASSKKDFVDPVKGYNINVERTGQGLMTRYPEVEADESPSKVPLSILAAVKPLEDAIPKYDEEDQKGLYFGRPKKDEDSGSGSNRGSGRNRRVADEEEEPADEEPMKEETVDEESVEEPAEEEPADEEPAEEEETVDEEPAEEEETEEEYEADPEPEEEPEPAPPPRRTTAKPVPAARPATEKPAQKLVSKPAPKPAPKSGRR
jgi:hypothetical protein